MPGWVPAAQLLDRAAVGEWVAAAQQAIGQQATQAQVAGGQAAGQQNADGEGTVHLGRPTTSSSHSLSLHWAQKGRKFAEVNAEQCKRDRGRQQEEQAVS